MQKPDYARMLEVLPRDCGALKLAAAMLQYPGIYSDGLEAAEADEPALRSMLRPIQREGFDACELSCSWMDVTKMDAVQLADFASALSDMGLSVAGCLIARRSIVNSQRHEENIAYTAEVIRRAPSLGSKFVCIGLHEIDPPEPDDPIWFWNRKAKTADLSAQFHPAVRSLKALSRIADDHGVQLALETYPGTLVGTTDGAADLYEAVDHPNFGVNPDLGNFVRVQGPTEDWREMVVRLMPMTNYWHVKNYARMELPETGQILTSPCPLDQGFVDYRKAFAFAVAQGFSGPVILEHYGGDGLAVAGQGRRYIERM